MKKFIIWIYIILLSIPGFSQNPSSPVEKHDTIIRLGGKKLVVDISNVSSTGVTYKLVGETENKTLERKQIEKIKYKSGRVDIFNKPVLQMLNESQWEAVLVTEKKGDIEGMHEYGLIESNSSSDARSTKAAKKSATIRLQKKAANLGANIILITKAEAIGGYGEQPGYNMAGICYGFEPPNEDVKKKLQDLNSDKKAMPDKKDVKKKK
jgi:hypothetical protein